jgi:hypothetical protein
MLTVAGSAESCRRYGAYIFGSPERIFTHQRPECLTSLQLATA